LPGFEPLFELALLVVPVLVATCAVLCFAFAAKVLLDLQGRYSLKPDEGFPDKGFSDEDGPDTAEGVDQKLRRLFWLKAEGEGGEGRG
jgi:hypothetical protein